MAVSTERVRGAIVYRRALRSADLHERADLCEALVAPGRVSSERLALDAAGVEHPEWAAIRDRNAGARIYGGGTVLGKIRGMGTVYDWRRTTWAPPNGGEIPLWLFVDHIPVIPNMPGIADFIRLRDVLVVKGLMVQTATDSAGNVALYCRFDRLCYHARGVNQFSVGCEHMHYSTGDDWTRQQFNAASYVHWMAREYHGLRASAATLAAGNGVVRVQRKGRTSHKLVSAFAGYHDRSDPGDKPAGKFDVERVRQGVVYFDEHRHFGGF